MESSEKVEVLYGPKAVNSSWLSQIAYIYNDGEQGVAIQFKDGTEVFYPGTDKSDYDYLSHARSKGKAVHSRFYDLEYVLL